MNNVTVKKYIAYISVCVVLLFVFTAMLTLCAGTFKQNIEYRLSRMLNKEVYIGGIKVGLPFNIVLKNVRLAYKEDKKTFFEAKRLVLKYNPLDILFGNYRKVRFIYVVAPKFFLRDIENIPFEINKNYKKRFPKELHVGIEDGTLGIGDTNIVMEKFWGRLNIQSDMIELKNIKATLFSLPMDLDGTIVNIPETPNLNITISMRNSDFSAFLGVKGPLSDSTINGWLRIFDKPKTHITGKLIFDKDIFRISNLVFEKLYTVDIEADFNKYNFIFDMSSLQESAVTLNKEELDIVQLKKSMFGPENISEADPQRKQFMFLMRLFHVDLFRYDVVLNTYLFGHVVSSAKDGSVEKIQGTLMTTNTLVDCMPAGELNANFEYQEGIVRLERFSFGDAFTMEGTVGLRKPYNINTKIQLTDLDLSDLVMFGRAPLRDSISGTVSGDMSAEGEVTKPRIRGRLQAKNGSLGLVNYDTVNVNLEGEGLDLKILDSQILRKEGNLMLSGFLNLSRLGRPRFFENMKVRSDKGTIVWAGWNIAKEDNEEELKLEKNIREDFKINFKKFINNEMYAQDVPDDELELEYKIKDNSSFKMRFKEQEETLQLQHNIKF
ncbi:MAG: hypothetical protein V1893_02670 [Candidatus Omnitrophota bacterium]